MSGSGPKTAFNDSPKTLDDVLACAKHREEEDGPDDWCALRVSGAEKNRWNGDYYIENFISLEYTTHCPYYARAPLPSIHDNADGALNPGFDFRSYDVMPPELTGGRGWCMAYCPQTPNYWGRGRCKAEDRVYDFCAPICSSSSCCLPEEG